MCVTEKACLIVGGIDIKLLCNCVPKRVICPRPAANDNVPPLRVVLEDGATILSVPYLQRMQVALNALRKSRREVPNWIADVLSDFDYIGGQVLYPVPGTLRALRTLIIEDDTVDAAFGSYEDHESSFRWVSDWRKSVIKQTGQARLLPRFQLMSAAFKVAYPCVAKHFA